MKGRFILSYESFYRYGSLNVGLVHCDNFSKVVICLAKITLQRIVTESLCIKHLPMEIPSSFISGDVIPYIQFLKHDSRGWSNKGQLSPLCNLVFQTISSWFFNSGMFYGSKFTFNNNSIYVRGSIDNFKGIWCKRKLSMRSLCCRFTLVFVPKTYLQ